MHSSEDLLESDLQSSHGSVAVFLPLALYTSNLQKASGDEVMDGQLARQALASHQQWLDHDRRAGVSVPRCKNYIGCAGSYDISFSFRISDGYIKLSFAFVPPDLSSHV